MSGLKSTWLTIVWLNVSWCFVHDAGIRWDAVPAVRRSTHDAHGGHPAPDEGRITDGSSAAISAAAADVSTQVQYALANGARPQ